MPVVFDPKPASKGPRSVLAGRYWARHKQQQQQQQQQQGGTSSTTTTTTTKKGREGNDNMDTNNIIDSGSEAVTKTHRSKKHKKCHRSPTPSNSRPLGQDLVDWEQDHHQQPQNENENENDNVGHSKNTKRERRSCKKGRMKSTTNEDSYDGAANSGTLLNTTTSAAAAAPIPIRRALGIDTRLSSSFGYTSVEEDDEDGDGSRLLLLQDFVRQLVARGGSSCCCFVTTTRSKAVAVDKLHSISQDDDDDDDDGDNSSNHNTKSWNTLFLHQDEKGDLVEEAVSTSSSWKELGNMVTRLVNADCKGRTSTSTGSNIRGDGGPLHVTLLTFDSTLLLQLRQASSDTSAESHRSAIRAWSRRCLQPLWDQQKLGHVHVIVVKRSTTTTIAGAVDDPETASSSSLPTPSAFEALIHAIQDEFDSITSHQQERQQQQQDFRPLEQAVSLTVMEHCAMSYQQLVRSWMQPRLLPFPISRHTLQLDLPPDNVNGAQCILQLSAAYQTMPFAANSPDFERLRVDLQQLCCSNGSCLRVVRTIAMNSVDASLFYGVPIQVQAALQDEYEPTLEMQRLVQALLRYLQQHQVVLLCESHSTATTSTSCGSLVGAAGLFGARGRAPFGERPTFVLLPQQQVTTTMVGASSTANSGLLFRYARAGQLVGMCDGGGALPAAVTMDEATSSEYQSYMEVALDGLLAPDNPLDENVPQEAIMMRSSRRLLGSKHASVGASCLSAPPVDGNVEDDWVQENQARIDQQGGPDDNDNAAIVVDTEGNNQEDHCSCNDDGDKTSQQALVPSKEQSSDNIYSGSDSDNDRDD